MVSWFDYEDYILTFNPPVFLEMFNSIFGNASNSTAIKPRVYYKKSSVILGIWIKSSSLAVLTIFSVLIQTASLVAEELAKNRENQVITEQMDASQVWENWLKKFNLFNSFVEKINACFGPIIFLTLSHIVISSIHKNYYCVIGIRTWYVDLNLVKDFRDFVSKNLPFVFLLYFRLIIIMAGSYRLQNKV